MSKYIKAWIGYNDKNKTHYYENFEVVENLPEIEKEFWNDRKISKIKEVELDCEQPNYDVYNYNFYEITEEVRYDDEIEESYSYVCVEKNDDEKSN